MASSSKTSSNGQDNLLEEISARLQKLEIGIQDQVYALRGLDDLIERGIFPPHMDGWSMSPDAVLAFLKLAHTKKPQVIMEFGSGASTFFIARYLKMQQPRTRFMSFEHNPDYFERTQAVLKENGLSDFADLRRVDLIEAGEKGRIWYDMSSTTRVADLVLIDGPPTSTAELARAGASFGLKKHVRPGTQIFLDDYRRESERKTVALWEKQKFAKLDREMKSLQRQGAVLSVL